MSLLRADKLVESVLGLDKVGIGQLRNVEYNKDYLWEVSFKGSSFAPPKPFDDFFPCVTVDFDAALLENFNYEQYMSTYEIPEKTGIRSLTITFNDDINNTLLKFFSDWMNIDILNHGHFISALLDDHPIVDIQNPDSLGVDSFGNRRNVSPVRSMRLSLLTTGKSKIYTRNLELLPKGALKLARTQSSEAVSYTLGFTVVSEIIPKDGGETASNIDRFREAAVGLIGRFI